MGLQMKTPCVLAVDDEPGVLALISAALGAEGYSVVTAASVGEFWLRAAECNADIYIVDIGLPDGNGLSVVRQLRGRSDRGILVLSGRGGETDHVLGLELGADDYVTKPFRLRELAARVNAIYRRCAASAVPATRATEPPGPDQAPDRAPAGQAADFTFGDYTISLSARRLWGPDMVEIDLTTAEFNLLAALVNRRTHVLTREQIMNAIKGRDWESYDRAVDGLVSRLRKKIPPRAADPQFIRTVHGVGYSFIS